MKSNNHLIIGLGGTGGKVIREFRKSFAREKSINAEVKYEFLYVDSNAEFMQHNDPTWKVLGKSVQLDQAQQLLIQSANLGAVINNPSGYPQIEPWLHPIAPIKHLIDVNTVAGGQRRKFGRFLFANKAREFIEMANSRIKALTENRGAHVTIHVICGLAGGTGSGSVVDVVAQLRKQYPNSSEIRIILYVALPEAIPKANWDSGNYHANGYAALLELNALAVGAYLPVDLTGEGGRRVPRASVQFNGCYVFSNENVSGYTVDTDRELPGIVAEYLFVKTQTTGWEALDKAESSENGTFDDEPSVLDHNEKQRSPRMLAFGIRRLVVPDEEIEEYLTYNFAEQAIRQSVFNNWVDGFGFSDESKPFDYGAEIRKPETLQKWLLSDDHLILSVGILPEDSGNARWKRIPEFWSSVVAVQKSDIQATKSDKTKWFSELKVRCEKTFDEGYRGLGGVKKFYEIKLKARLEMAKFVRAKIEEDLFADWRNGQRSVVDLDRVLSALISSMEEKLSALNQKLDSNSRAAENHLAKIGEVERQMGDVGLLGKVLLNKLGDLFNEGSAHLQDWLVCRTQAEGIVFAKKLLEEILQQLVDLKMEIGRFQAKLMEAGKSFSEEVAIRLKQEKVDYKQKLFNIDAIKGLSKTLITSQDVQREQSEAVRQALIAHLGAQQRQLFSSLNERVDIGVMKSALESACMSEVRRAHETVGAAQKRVMNVNIVAKIRDDFGGSDERLREFVREMINKAGVFAKFNQTQIALSGPGTIPERVGKTIQTTGVFLPNCKEAPEFREKLASLFSANSSIASLSIRDDGARSNEITVIGVTNLFTLRCIDALGLLGGKYEARREQSEEAKSLMHSEGDGNRLPPLFVPTMSQIKESKLPFVLLARASGMVCDRADIKTGKPLVIFTCEEDGLPTDFELGKGDFLKAIEDMNSGVLSKLEQEIRRKIGGMRHPERLALFEDTKAVVKKIYEDRGSNASDDVYLKFAGLLRGEVKLLLELA